MGDVVRVDVVDRISHVTIDNGKANVLGHAVLDGLDAALSQAEEAGPSEIGAVVIAGREGILTGGFDLKVMMEGPQSAGDLVTKGGALFTRMYGSSVPVITACTGHAVAAGALLLLASDERVGAAGDFQIGLIETAKGMVLPRWAVELADERLSRRHRQIATVGARMYPPAEARDAGFLDRVVEPDEVIEVATAAARVWAALPRGAYSGQVTVNRGERLARLKSAVDSDRGGSFTLAPS